MIEALSNFHFIRPAWLLLLPLAWLVWWYWQRLSDPLRGWRAQMDPELLEALAVGGDFSRRGPGRLLLIAWLLAGIIVAGPTWQLERNPFTDESVPLMNLLKADISMDTPDPAPSRQERAHLKIADIAEVRQGQPLGLIAYAGTAHLVLPPTKDTSVVAQMAAEISADIMPVAGDRLDLAIKMAGEALGSEGEGGRLLVITDSVGADPKAIRDAQEAAGELPVHFLVINHPDSSDLETLRSVAKGLKAPVQELTPDDADVRAITRAAARVPGRGAGDSKARWQEAGYWLTPALALMVAGSFRRTNRRNEEKE